MTSDLLKPLDDRLLDKLLHLPARPASPLVGAGYQRAKFPRRGQDLFLTRVWCAIPSAHKHEELGCISPEAFNVLIDHLPVGVII